MFRLVTLVGRQQLIQLLQRKSLKQLPTLLFLLSLALLAADKASLLPQALGMASQRQLMPISGK